MGDGVSDLVRRGEASDQECEAAVLRLLDQGGGVFTWWPGGRHHSAVLRLRDRGVVRLEDVSESQETRYEVWRTHKGDPP